MRYPLVPSCDVPSYVLLLNSLVVTYEARQCLFECPMAARLALLAAGALNGAPTTNHQAHDCSLGRQEVLRP